MENSQNKEKISPASMNTQVQDKVSYNMDELLDIAKNINKHHENRLHADEIKDEWIYVSTILDRCFFLLFITVSLTAGLMILTQRPSDDQLYKATN